MIFRQVMQAGRAVAGFAAGRFRRVSEEVLTRRRALCLACEHWDAMAFAGTGRCLLCGCSCWKLHFPKSSCPVGKWAAVTMPA